MRKCKHCKKEFEHHGNSRYCPPQQQMTNEFKKSCYTKEKLKRQKENKLKSEKLIQEKYYLKGILDLLLLGKKEVVIDPKTIGNIKFELFEKIKIWNTVVYSFENYNISKYLVEEEEKLILMKNTDENNGKF
jgi:hypothetical protein